MQRNELHAASPSSARSPVRVRRAAYARHYRFRGAEASMLQAERVRGHSPEIENVRRGDRRHNEPLLKVRGFYAKLATSSGDKRKSGYVRFGHGDPRRHAHAGLPLTTCG
jgi:hypothetical protein